MSGHTYTQDNYSKFKVQSSCCALFGIKIKHAKLSIHLYIHITIQHSNKKYRVDKEIKIQYCGEWTPLLM